MKKPAETPHAVFGGEQTRSRGAHFPWIAASARIEQNLNDMRTIATSIGIPLQVLWDSFKSILQVGRNRNRNQHISGKLFRGRVYFCRLVLDDVEDDGNADEEDWDANRHGGCQQNLKKGSSN